MRLIQQLFGSTILMFANITILIYVCQRVGRARDNVQYIGEQVAKGMEEIKGDVGEELRVTDQLTAQSSKLAEVLQRFATLEENVIELVRMDRDRESVRIETPEDVNEEVKRIVAAAQRKKNEKREQPSEKVAAGAPTIEFRRHAGRVSAQRNPLSKFSACSPRDVAFSARKSIDDRPRTLTTPEVRLLGEEIRPIAAREE